MRRLIAISCPACVCGRCGGKGGMVRLAGEGAHQLGRLCRWFHWPTMLNVGLVYCRGHVESWVRGTESARPARQASPCWGTRARGCWAARCSRSMCRGA
eukprot:scaffold4177_cov425-Prasinococcus_capsulatus_cf.AAC.5